MDKGEVGSLGESIACSFLVKRGFRVVDRNFRRKWGEIDIVAKDPKGILHFVEVKSAVSDFSKVSRETSSYRPEENVHPMKVKRLMRTVQSYLAERAWEGEWQFDVAAVFLDPERKQAKVKFLPDLILGS